MELEACLIVVMGADELVVVVRGVAGVDAVRPVDQSNYMSVVLNESGTRFNLLKIVECPVVSLLDVEDTSLFVRKRLI